MTQEEVIELMRQAMAPSVFEDLHPYYVEEFAAFAALVEAKAQAKKEAE